MEEALQIEPTSRRSGNSPTTMLPDASLEAWLSRYRATLTETGKNDATITAYLRVIRQFGQRLADRPTSAGQFLPEHITRVAIEVYVSSLKSTSHKNVARSALAGFCTWLEEQGVLAKNPMRGLYIPAQAILAPRVLTVDQRYVLRDLVDREADLRGKATFALGYFAGCRVSDVSWLLRENVQVSAKAGWVTVGHKGGKIREIDLTNEARRALYDYLAEGGRKDSAYVFTSQREKQTRLRGEIDGWRWSEDAIHVWWQHIKERARRKESELIDDLTFHDLRHDFAHRARAAGWTLEEIAYYLGHVTRAGTPAIQTTARYTQVSREQVKDKLQALR